MTTKQNGTNLTPERQAAFEHTMAAYHELVADRDRLHKETILLKTDIAGLKVAFDAQAAQIAEMESRVATANLVRDQALAERIKYEALFISVQAQLRAFQVPAAPLIKETSDYEAALPRDRGAVADAG